MGIITLAVRLLRDFNGPRSNVVPKVKQNASCIKIKIVTEHLSVESRHLKHIQGSTKIYIELN